MSVNTSLKLYSPLLTYSSVLLLSACAATTPARISSPSFDCSAQSNSTVPQAICSSSTLAELDRQLAKVYKQAQEKSKNGQPPRLQAEQRGWIKGRDECWKASDLTQCIETSYRQRIATLQANYRLLPVDWAQTYSCNGYSRHEIHVSYFDTQPASLIAERGDSMALMMVQKLGENNYIGRNERLTLVGNSIDVVWSYGGELMHCQPHQDVDVAFPKLCSAAWFDSVDKQLITGDSQGHGPDIGSDEWKSVVEFKLGVRGQSSVPERHTPQWCDYIAEKVSNGVNTRSK